MDPFKLVHTWEGNPDEYAAYFLYEQLKANGCVNAAGKVELIQSSGVFCQTPAPYTYAELGKRLRARVINVNRVAEIYCQLHCLSCINFTAEEKVAQRKLLRQQDLQNNISLLSDREREELLYLTRWLHDKKERAYFTQYDEYTQEYCVKMYKVVIADEESFFVPDEDVRAMIGDALFEQLSDNPLNG